MMQDGDGKTEKTGKINGVKDVDGKNEMQGSKEKFGVNNDEEVVFQKTVQGEIPRRQSGLEKYWTAVKNGASGVIVKVKEEKTPHKNSFDALNEEEKEWDAAEATNIGDEDNEIEFQAEGTGRDIRILNMQDVEEMQHNEIAETLYTYYIGKKLGATRKVYYLLNSNDAKEQLCQLVRENIKLEEPNWEDDLNDMNTENMNGIGKNIRNIHLKEVESMKHKDIAETLYMHNYQQNQKVARSEYYSLEDKQAKVQLIQMINTSQKNDFLARVERVITDIKNIDVSVTMKEMGQAIISEVCELSEITYISCKTDVTVRRKLYQYQEYISMIEKYLKDPIIMIPEHMFQLSDVSETEIVEADYFKLVFAVIVAKTVEDGTTKLTMRQLRIKAMKLRRSVHIGKKSETKGSNDQISPKKFKRGKKSSISHKDLEESQKNLDKTIESQYTDQKADMKEQFENLNGMNVDSVMSKEEVSEGPNFSLPVKTKKVEVIQKTKNEYMIHNRIHVTNKSQAQKIVQIVFRVLRRADPTVNIIPLSREEKTQNDNLDQEDQIPESEDDLKKWIDIAKRQQRNKFTFSMRIAITETPELVKSRIFEWCRGQKHYIEFKRLTTANIFFAGWLYHIHPKYHNRDDVRDWMAEKDSALKQDIHLAPGKVFKTLKDDKKTQIITDGLRVEVTFERREAVLQALFSLKWEKGPYNKSCFVPYRVNDHYTDGMQAKFIKQQQIYVKNTKQHVFRMKAPKWEIENRTDGKTTTFKQWIQNSKVNNEKIVDSLEVGNDEYVRIVYHERYDEGIKVLMRNLQDATEKTFGMEIKNKLFSITNGGPITSSLAALEENYAQKLEKVLSSTSNPQNDDDDYIQIDRRIKPKQKNHVYFESQMNETFADKVRKSNTGYNIEIEDKESENNGVNKEANKKEYKKEILEEVNQIIDQKMGHFEKKVHMNLQTITDKQDRKINQLQNTVATNYRKSEESAKQRNDEIQEHMNAQKLFMANMSKHFNFQMKPPPMKPPGASVELSSREGGSQK